MPDLSQQNCGITLFPAREGFKEGRGVSYRILQGDARAVLRTLPAESIRPRRQDEGSDVLTRYEQREYARQLRASPHTAKMKREAGPAWAHYIRFDRSGARPIPPKLLNKWLDWGWLVRPVVPRWDPPAVEPAIVLDPFAGSGRAGLAALRLGRSFLGAEVNPDYVLMAQWQAERLTNDLSGRISAVNPAGKEEDAKSDHQAPEPESEGRQSSGPHRRVGENAPSQVSGASLSVS
jgi:hypothetical protein